MAVTVRRAFKVDLEGYFKKLKSENNGAEMKSVEATKKLNDLNQQYFSKQISIKDSEPVMAPLSDFDSIFIG